MVWRTRTRRWGAVAAGCGRRLEHPPAVGDLAPAERPRSGCARPARRTRRWCRGRVQPGGQRRTRLERGCSDALAAPSGERHGGHELVAVDAVDLRAPGDLAQERRAVVGGPAGHRRHGARAALGGAARRCGCSLMARPPCVRRWRPARSAPRRAAPPGRGRAARSRPPRPRRRGPTPKRYRTVSANRRRMAARRGGAGSRWPSAGQPAVIAQPLAGGLHGVFVAVLGSPAPARRRARRRSARAGTPPRRSRFARRRAGAACGTRPRASSSRSASAAARAGCRESVERAGGPPGATSRPRRRRSAGPPRTGSGSGCRGRAVRAFAARGRRPHRDARPAWPRSARSRRRTTRPAAAGHAGLAAQVAGRGKLNAFHGVGLLVVMGWCRGRTRRSRGGAGSRVGCGTTRPLRAAAAAATAKVGFAVPGALALALAAQPLGVLVVHGGPRADADVVADAHERAAQAGCGPWPLQTPQ